MPCDANLEVAYMHLTNYNINKFSDDFCDDIGGGTKRFYNVSPKPFSSIM